MAAIDFAADLAILYGEEFARPFRRMVGGVPGASFRAIPDASSQSALNGYALGTYISIAYPASVGLVDGDHIQRMDGPAPVSYTVRGPRVRLDGLHATATLEQRA